MFTQITHISLLVHDIDEALNFYTQKFGFIKKDDITADWGRWVTISFPEQPSLEIAFMLATNPEMQNLVGKQAGSYPFLAFATTDCQATYKELMAKEVECLGTPTVQPWGVQLLCKDLYGNLFCIVQPQ